MCVCACLSALIICDSVSSAQYQTASDIMLNNTSLSFSLSCTRTYTHCMVCAKAWISYDLTAFRGRGRNVQGVQQSHQSVPHQAGRLPRLKQPYCIFAMLNAKFILYSNLLYKVGIIMLLYYNLCHGYTVTQYINWSINSILSIHPYPQYTEATGRAVKFRHSCHHTHSPISLAHLIEEFQGILRPDGI